MSEPDVVEDVGTGDEQSAAEKRKGHAAQLKASAAVGGADYLSPEEAQALKETKAKIEELGEKEPPLVAGGLTPAAAPIKSTADVGPVAEAPAPEPVVEHRAAAHQSSKRH